MAVDLTDPKMDGFTAIQNYRDLDLGRSSRRIRKDSDEGPLTEREVQEMLASLFAEKEIVDELNRDINLSSYVLITDIDHTNAMNRALSAVEASGKPLRIGAGVFNFSAKITKTFTKPLVIKTAGRGATTLRWTNADGGLSIIYSGQAKGPTIEPMTFLTTQSGGGTALTITSGVLTTSWANSVLISDPEIRGDDTSTDYWDTGVRLVNCWYPRIIRPVIKGKDESALPFSMDYGIVGESCQALVIRDVTFQHIQRGYMTTGSTFGEGLDISGGEMVGVYIGVDHVRASATSGARIHSIHINAYYRCIYLNNIAQMNVFDNLLYKTQISTLDWQGVELSTCLNCNVHDNEIATPGVPSSGAGTQFGITLAGTDDCNIHDNNFAYWASGGAGVLVATGSDKNRIYNNTKPIADAAPTNTVLFSGAGTNNRAWNNTPFAEQALAQNSTAPSVDNSLGEYYRTQNTVSTTLTTLGGGYAGQRITIRINDGNTGILSGTGAGAIYLKGNVNVSVGTGAGNSITFVYDGSRWNEIGRSFA